MFKYYTEKLGLIAAIGVTYLHLSLEEDAALPYVL